MRITASKKAHNIKTRKKDFQKLASRFYAQRYSSVLTDAMRYGISMEPEAKRKLSEKMQQKIFDSGLIISLKQPFLACSPDGIVENGNVLEIVEIKCPFTCKNSIIFDPETGTSFVDYLIVDKEKKPELKKTHIYYTQVQMCLYVTGLEVCNFFVYSSLNSVLLRISRDEAFLENIVPKIENFYFSHLLQCFCNE